MKTIITFKEDTHQYFNQDGVEYRSVSKVGEHFFGEIQQDEQFLRQYAERGTALHEEIEQFIINGVAPHTGEAMFFKEWWNGQCLEVRNSATVEQIVYSDKYKMAGRYDLRFEVGGYFYMFDTKSGNKYLDQWLWKQSFYAMMDAEKTNNAYDKYKGLIYAAKYQEFIPLDLVDIEIVHEALDKNYYMMIDPKFLKEHYERLKDYDLDFKALEKTKQSTRDVIEDEVRRFRLTSHKYELGTISISAPSETLKLDEDKLFAERPLLHSLLMSRYGKISNRKSTTTFRLKDTKY